MSKSLAKKKKPLNKSASLTNPERPDNKGALLANLKARPFLIVFKDKLQKDFNFEKLQKSHLKQFQSFLDIVSQMSFNDVEKLYGRKPDKNDTYQDRGVVHFEVSQSFRIHGIIEGEYFIALRLDPNHKVHD
jgi:hypothetical protein